MFIGHWAPALAAAAASPKAPRLGVLFVAAQLVDWAFFGLAIVGIEKLRIVPGITTMNPLDLYHMPYTHSLLGTLVFAVIFGLLIGWALREIMAGVIAGGVVLSHWLLDLIVHRPDLTLAGGEHTYGLGLWNYPLIAMPLELAITVGAWWWYVSKTRGPIGQPIILLVLLLLFQAVNWFGPQPVEADLGMKILALASFALATLAAWWVGTTRRHRRDRG